jgi:polynucleotide 5'-kinase involved in rRNA processing
MNLCDNLPSRGLSCVHAASETSAPGVWEELAVVGDPDSGPSSLSTLFMSRLKVVALMMPALDFSFMSALMVTLST